MGPSSAARTCFATALVVALTACGSDSSGSDAAGRESSEGESFADQPVEDILTAAQEAANAAESVHVEGMVTHEGDEISLDLDVSRAGACRGSLGIKKATMEVLMAEDRLFYRPDQAFYELSGDLTPEEAARAVETVGDRWIEDDAGEFADVCDLDGLIEEGDDSLLGNDPEKAAEDLTARGKSDVGGVEVVELEGTSDGNPVSLFIAVEDPHHLMRMSAEGAEESGDLTLTEWDQPVDAEVPGKSEIFVPPSD